jgi:hypothetical protein
MTLGSAAFLSGPAPATPLPAYESFQPPIAPDADAVPLGPDRKALPGSEEEDTILYRVNPPVVSWPRVFPQL